MTSSLSAYVCQFIEFMIYLAVMSDIDKIIWFRQGLTTQLQSQCQYDKDGQLF